jgi:hypothetical protein
MVKKDTAIYLVNTFFASVRMIRSLPFPDQLARIPHAFEIKPKIK